MNDLTPTRSLLIALGDERRTMREGYAFLDEKCLLLAGEMRQYRRHQEISRDLAVLLSAARRALGSALARHGLHGLQVVPPAPSHQRLRVERHPLLGIITLQAQALGELGAAPQPVQPSPEADACRAAYARVAARVGELAAVSTTLARLLAEYRRTVRRVRALQDVLLPELDADIADIETRLEDLEREDALTARGFGRLAALPLPTAPMREMHRSALVPYSAEQMFDLIERVEHYPQFLPWCTRTQLIERTDEIVAASVEVGFRELHVRVTTRNEKRRPERMAIHMQDGSFRHFFGEWTLAPLGTLGSRIDFTLRYELALHAEKLAGPLIDHAANQMVDAFVRRAEAVYGTADGDGARIDGPGQPAAK